VGDGAGNNRGALLGDVVESDELLLPLRIGRTSSSLCDSSEHESDSGSDETPDDEDELRFDECIIICCKSRRVGDSL
jgi:hypothetical protein